MSFKLLRTVSFYQKIQTKVKQVTIVSSHPYCSRSSDTGNESESEKWRRLVSDSSSGYTTCFEDDEGNILTPRGKISNAIALKSLKPRSTIERKNTFVDWKRAVFIAGNGGPGCISFLSYINQMMAGPDGGDGGPGGHIILRANTNVKSLVNISSTYRAPNGEAGMGKDMTGAPGEHIYIDVPVGTIVRMPTNDGKIIADLNIDKSMYIIARGGAGGKGNHFFLSDKNRHPRVAEFGGIGERHVRVLELRTLAHCGFVGLPNVGKSTLLRAISRARPRVAAYPFTTLNPYIGIIQYDDYIQLSVADLPGLIKGAHLNHGLGIDFLKHVERCVCLMFVVDVSQSNVVEQLEILKTELEMFKPGLANKPHAIIANKVDYPEAKEQVKLLRQYLQDNTPEGKIPLPIIEISAKYGFNIKELVDHIRALYDLYNESVSEDTFEW